MTKRCAQCGKSIRRGAYHIVFDGTDCFCDFDCATKYFAGDASCVEIMLEEGDRLVWKH